MFKSFSTIAVRLLFVKGKNFLIFPLTHYYIGARMVHVMDIFAFLLLFAFTVVVAMGFNFLTPRFAATNFGKRFTGNYALVTLGTALVLLVAIYGAALLSDVAGVRATKALPDA